MKKKLILTVTILPFLLFIVLFSYTRFTRLNDHISILESQISDLEGKLYQLEIEKSDLESRIDDLELYR